MSLIGEKIKALPLKREEAECPEWQDSSVAGGRLYVREMTGEERLEHERKQLQGGIDNKGELDRRKFIDVQKRLRQDLVVLTLVDGQGEQVFGDIDDLAEVSGEVVSRLADQATRISNLAPEAVEDDVGNSDDNQAAATG